MPSKEPFGGRWARAAVVVAGLLVAACGARTGIEVADRASDGGADGARCARNRDCDDGLSCTADRCRDGRCVREPRDARCRGSVCTVGRCDPTLGCVAEPLACDDGVACTVDGCDEAAGCVHEPTDARCPISHRCDALRGCVARALVHDGEALYEVELPGGDLRLLTETGPSYTDIALAPDRQLYGVSRTGLFRLFDDDPLADRLGDSDDWVALDVGPDGVLYAAGENDRIVAIDRETFRPRVVARLPAPFVASGDIAFVDGRMLVTVTDRPSSSRDDTRLAEVDLAAGSARVLGRTGQPCIWALAAFGSELYGFTCNGALLRIDPATARSEVLRVLGLRVGGAAAR